MTNLWSEKLSHSVCAIAMALVALVVCLALTAQTREGDDAEIRNVMNMYAEAVNKADAPLGSQLWCGSEEAHVQGGFR